MPQHYHRKNAAAAKLFRCECGRVAVKWDSGCWACAECLRRDAVYNAENIKNRNRGVGATTKLKYIGGSKLNWERYGRTA